MSANDCYLSLYLFYSNILYLGGPPVKLYLENVFNHSSFHVDSGSEIRYPDAWKIIRSYSWFHRMRCTMAKKERSITIKDVAKAANVSITTVSRVLNNQKNAVNHETSERIKKVIAELNFVPNAMARGLHSDQTRTVGLIIQDISNPYYPGIVEGVERAAQDFGYSIILANAQRSRTRQYMELLHRKRVDGVILAGGGVVRNVTDLNLQNPSDVKSVVIGKPMSEDSVSVQIDNVNAARLAAQFLVDHGHTHIAMITGVSNSSTSADREAGFVQALAKNNLEIRKDWITRGNFVYEGGFTAVYKLPLDKYPITAIFAHNDLMAIGAINALHKRGFRVPDDISVIGFDDIQFSSYITPALTTVHVPFAEMGRVAMVTLANLLAKQKPAAVTHMPVFIEERETVLRRG